MIKTMKYNVNRLTSLLNDRLHNKLVGLQSNMNVYCRLLLGIYIIGGRTLTDLRYTTSDVARATTQASKCPSVDERRCMVNSSFKLHLTADHVVTAAADPLTTLEIKR